METFVRANSKSGMLATRDPKPLENLTAHNVYVITPAALDALAHVLANHEADTRREFVDISLTTIARILMRADADVEPVRKARRPNDWGDDSSSSSDERPESVSGLEAARQHMHAWLNLLPRQWDLARTGLDDQLNSMTRRCDLQMLREIQSLRAEFRSSQERLMASQQETQDMQQDMQALLTRLAERVDDNTSAGQDRDGAVMQMLRTQQNTLNCLLERHTLGSTAQVESHTDIGCRQAKRVDDNTSVRQDGDDEVGLLHCDLEQKSAPTVVPPNVPIQVGPPPQVDWHRAQPINPQIVGGRLEIGLPSSCEMSATAMSELFRTHPQHEWKNANKRGAQLRAFKVRRVTKLNRRVWLGVRACRME